MSKPDLAPLRASLDALCLANRDFGASASNWPGWFEAIGPKQAEDGTISMPHVRYGARVSDLWSAFRAAGWSQAPFDWMDWLQSCRIDPYSPEAIAWFDFERLSALLMAIDRQERFCDGHWAECLRQRTFERIAERWISNVRYQEIVTRA